MTALVDLPQIAVVVVNFRGWDDLASCLASLAAVPDEIVVVDNASGDGRFGEFERRHRGVRFIENSGNHGFAHACNVGAAATSAPLILFLNPDSRDPGGQLTRMLRLAQAHPEAGILSVRQVDEAGRPQRVFDSFPSLLTLFGPLRAIRRLLMPKRYPDPRSARHPWLEVDWVSGSALMIRRELLERLGGWDAGYWMYSEDVDLCFRARASGWKTFYSGAATLVHRHGGSSRRDLETAALTKAETTISRHYFAHRHFTRLHAAGYHGALFLIRFLPEVAAAMVGTLIPLKALQRRSMTAGHLARYYRRVWETGDWRSPRARSGPNQGPS